MSKKEIRRLADLRNDPVWRDFVGRFVVLHGRSWSRAELHWLEYVGESLELRDLAAYSGARLTRKAEAWASRMLMARMLGGAQWPTLHRGTKIEPMIEAENKRKASVSRNGLVTIALANVREMPALSRLTAAQKKVAATALAKAAKRRPALH